MKDKDIIRQINTAYDVRPSERGKEFIRKYRTRRIRTWDILKTELRYGKWVMMLPVFILFVIATLLCVRDEKYVWMFSSVLPVVVLFSIVLFGRAGRYGMWELESISRFSGVFIKMVRLIIAGLFSVLFLMLVSMVMFVFLKIKATIIIMTIGVPFLSTAFVSLMILRRWRAENNIYVCLAFSAGFALVPYLNRIRGILIALPLGCAVTAVMILSAAVIAEAIGYVRFESEEAAWNY